MAGLEAVWLARAHDGCGGWGRAVPDASGRGERGVALGLKCFQRPHRADQCRAGAQRLDQLFLRRAVLDRRIRVNADANVTTQGDGAVECDELARARIELPGTGAGAAQDLVAVDRVGAQFRNFPRRESSSR